MKTFSRAIIFSAVSIYLIEVLVHGFSLTGSAESLALVIVALGLFHTLLAPIMKTLLLPLNVITFGFFSTVVYVVVFHFILQNVGSARLEQWVFQGYNVGSVVLPKIPFSEVSTGVLVAVFYSFLMATMHKLL